MVFASEKLIAKLGPSTKEMFFIVEFTDTNEVALVPGNWLEGTRCVLWPNTSNPAGSAKKREEPTRFWKAFPVKFLFWNSDYDTVRKRLKRAEKTSDLENSTTAYETEEEVGDRRTSRRQAISAGVLERTSTRSDTECDQSSEEDGTAMNEAFMEDDGPDCPPGPSSPSRRPNLTPASQLVSAPATLKGGGFKENARHSHSSDSQQDRQPMPGSSYQRENERRRTDNVFADQRENERRRTDSPCRNQSPLLYRHEHPNERRRTDSPLCRTQSPLSYRRETLTERVRTDSPYMRRNLSPLPHRHETSTERRRADSPFMTQSQSPLPYHGETLTDWRRGDSQNQSPLPYQENTHMPELSYQHETGRLQETPSASIAHTRPATLDQIFSGMEKLFVNQHKMLTKLQAVNEQNDRIMRRMAAGNLEGSQPLLPDACSLPLQNQASLEALEDYLLHHSNKPVVGVLSVLGGSTLKEVVWNILFAVLDHDLAMTFCWAGSHDKKAFRTLRLHETVCEAVRKHSNCKNETNHNIKEAMKNWFRGCEDRKGGKKRREDKKEEKRRENEGRAGAEDTERLTGFSG